MLPLYAGSTSSSSSGASGLAAGGVGACDPSAEKRYRKLLSGVDLTKHFYFSYTYDLAKTLQYNCCGPPQVQQVDEL